MSIYNAEGMRLTDCCGAASKFFGAESFLSCKKCGKSVPHGQGDGSEYETEIGKIRYQIQTLKHQLAHWESKLKAELGQE